MAAKRRPKGKQHPPHPDTLRLVACLSAAIEADQRSRPEIATRAALPLATVHRIMTGERQPKLDSVVRIALALGKKIQVSD